MSDEEKQDGDQSSRLDETQQLPEGQNELGAKSVSGDNQQATSNQVLTHTDGALDQSNS